MKAERDSRIDGLNEQDETSLLTGPLLETEMPGVVAVEPDCPKCTGPMIRCQIGHVGIYGWWVERESRQTGALGPPRPIKSDVVARVCTRCGYTELYAVDPRALLGREEEN